MLKCRSSLFRRPGRDYTDYRLVFERLSALPRDTTIIHGGARGADLLADFAAKALGLPAPTSLPISKDDWAMYGKRAGRIRNHAMLALKPDLVIAFPGGNGTAHMVEIAQEAGVPVERLYGTVAYGHSSFSQTE